MLSPLPDEPVEVPEPFPRPPDEARGVGVAEGDVEPELVLAVVFVDALRVGDTGFVERAVSDGAED